MKTVDSVRTHIKKNKNAYIAGGVCLVLGAAAGAIALTKMSPNAEIVQRITQIGHHNTALMITLIENSTPSKAIRIKGTNQVFNSISEASRLTGLDRTLISRNINGHLADVKGVVFELIDVGANLAS